MEFTVRIRDRDYQVVTESDGEGYRIRVGTKQYRVKVLRRRDNVVEAIIDGRKYTIYYARRDNRCYLSIDGDQFELEEVVETKGRISFKDNILVAPMTGSIVKINYKVGDIVPAGKTIMILEAMKMENELKAPYSARIKKLSGKVGDQVEGGKPLIELEPVE